MKKTAAAMGISFFCTLLSLSAYLLYWRTANEPGATPVTALLNAHYILLALGAAGTILSGAKAFRQREKRARTVLIPMAIAVFIYLPVFFLTVMMLT